MERLEYIARVGVPLDAELGEGVEKEIAYWNYSSAGKWEEEVRGEAIADLVRGGASIFRLEPTKNIRGLRISPVGVVEGKDKRRIVHNVTSGQEGNGGK